MGGIPQVSMGKSEANQHGRPASQSAPHVVRAAANWESCPVNVHLALWVGLAGGISQLYCVCVINEDA